MESADSEKFIQDIIHKHMHNAASNFHLFKAYINDKIILPNQHDNFNNNFLHLAALYYSLDIAAFIYLNTSKESFDSMKSERNALGMTPLDLLKLYHHRK